jgi:hypothetical protein
MSGFGFVHIVADDVEYIVHRTFSGLAQNAELFSSIFSRQFSVDMYVEPNYLNFSLVLALGREAVSSQNSNIAFS